jgi:hypothetical protein
MPGSGFALAGGTSLALRFGHRISVDLDFFTAGEFDPESLQRRLVRRRGQRTRSGFDHSCHLAEGQR